tara:strand:+ start:18380 stop:19246 length:867 start_codon:yes stop_codon:yes gene_type:complete
MKKILLSLLLISSLFGQVNRILTLSPTAQEASLGNQSLAFHNPARNYFDTDSLVDLSFTRVNWLSNITEDMGYNYIGAGWKNLTFSLLYFDYGAQNIADEAGIISGQFSPNSLVAYVGWGTELKHTKKKLENVSIGFGGKIVNHSLHTENATGLLVDAGVHFNNLWSRVDLDIAIQNFGYQPKFNNWKTEVPTSFNVGFSVPVKDFRFYNQWNLYDGYHTHGQGLKYTYKNLMSANIGYYNDVNYDLNYSSFGLDFKYESYKIGFGYILGDETFPLSDTIQLTINVEI